MKGRTLLKAAALLAVLSMLAVAVLAGCGGEAGLTLESGKLTMGSDVAYPPFENMENDEAVGFDVDLATEIAKRLDLELEVIPTAWDGIIPGLKTDKYDVIMSAMTITDERKQEINFSDPYIDSNQSLTVVKGSEIESTDDLEGKVVGVQLDTTGQFTTEENQEDWGISDIKKFDTILLAFADLEQGNVDAIINDFPVSAYISKERGDTEVVETIKTDEQYGIGVKKGNDELLEKINTALKEIKDDGTYDEIYEKWFGTAPTTG